MALTVMPSWGDNYQVKKSDNEQAIVSLLQEQEDLFLLITSYQPKLKSSLNQQKLGGTPYWTAFDALQRVTLKDKKPLQVDHLTWPSNAHFIRLFDRIVVLADNRLYANIFFTYPMGDQIDRVDLMENNELKQQLTIDDRGFVSRVAQFENGQPKEISYLSQGGFVVAKEHFNTGVVEALLPDGQEKTYSSMNALIDELTLAYLNAKQNNELLVFDSDQNWRVIKQASVENVAYWLPESNVPVQKAEQLKAMKNVTTLSSEDNGAADILLSPYAVEKKPVAQPKDQELIYINLGDLALPKQQDLLRQAFHMATMADDRTFIFEGMDASLELAGMLNKMVQERSEAFGWEEGQDAVLKARFVFLQAQSKKGRNNYLATCSAYCDLSESPSLQALAQATSFALPTLTKGQNFYQQQVYLKQDDTMSFEETLLSLLKKAKDEGFKEELIAKRDQFTPEKLEAAWNNALKIKTTEAVNR
ncbi:accessory Sec system glycosyltransferase Asp1 [Fructobacillus sp. M2-14]|uniref:Accessory Sec system glycosyltransferase Asp1 n=1 Tax=Fructobacillus broussonetiae TaxID=2713173 RepID=A0ABS5R0C9_9LACO|nr:accessory Sec system glycosyltransferase Asp1 [Fructobacillus broussonetiae]MBS9338462.1 accessory Sec system glycosyltransferase Asp1 [Fructobacillus broussonetiae]